VFTESGTLSADFWYVDFVPVGVVGAFGFELGDGLVAAGALAGQQTDLGEHGVLLEQFGLLDGVQFAD